MNPFDASDATRPDAEPQYQVSASALAALRNPLTVILGHAQHLQRGIVQGRRRSPDDYLAALAAIERSVRDLERHVCALHEGTSRLPDADD